MKNTPHFENNFVEIFGGSSRNQVGSERSGKIEAKNGAAHQRSPGTEGLPRSGGVRVPQIFEMQTSSEWKKRCSYVG
jgi:hypothetical protein